MSQRNTHSLLSCSQSQRSQVGNKNPITEFFKAIVRDAGIKLSSSEEPNLITQEQALVVRDLDKKFDEHYSDDCIDKFLKGFKVLIKKERYLRKALLPTQFNKSSDEQMGNDTAHIQQESLFRIFLKTNHLQSAIIHILLDEITTSVSQESTEDTSWLRLLLSQMRYLPHITSPQTLTTTLLDLIDIAPFPSQLEILDFIPEILPDSEYKHTAQQLAKMLDHNNEQLCGAIIGCLNALDLDQEMRNQVQDHILAKMLTQPSIKLFPLFLEFLLTDCHNKKQDLTTTLIKIRTALNNIMASTEDESGKIVIVNRLQSLVAATIPKQVLESWLNIIARIKIHTDHKPVDLLILFMLHSSTKFKKRSIETIFRKRVKDGLFTCTLLERLFDKHLPQQLFHDYFPSMIEIGSSLLRTLVMTEFASTLFKLLFSHKLNTDPILRQEVLDSLILLANDPKRITTILHIFSSLIYDNMAKMQHHTVILMRLLENLDTYQPKDVKQVFDILATLTCSDDALSGHKEELHIIIRKQLGSSKRCLKHRGIVSAVMMAKHVAMTMEDTNNQMELSEDLSISHLQGRAKEAATLLELAKTSTSSHPQLLGLYYDQLASVLMKTDNLNGNFLTWLHDTVTNDFQSVFVTETVCPDIGDLQFSMQYNINTDEEMDTPIAVNIAELTLKNDKSQIVILAPHFRLLRLLHYRQQNGDLSSIDALLGCGVVLPNTEHRTGLEREQLGQMADCLFHCINWLREVISGFVTQKSRKLRHKVVQRIGNLIELEQILKECLDSVPGHTLPSSYFDVLNPVPKVTMSPPQPPPRKKLKTKSIVEDSVAATTTTSTKPVKKVREERTTSVTFRDIDVDVIKLVIYPLNTTPPMSSSDQTTLTLTQLNFILADFVHKLTKVTKGHDLGLSHLNTVTPTDLINDCRPILLNIHKHFEALITLIEEDEEDDRSTQVQTSFGLVLEILWLIFSWSGFLHHTKHLDLLRDILRAFRPNDSPPLNSVNRLSVDLVQRLSHHSKHCTNLSQTVTLIKIMEAVYTISPEPEIRKEITKTSGVVLGKNWTGSESTMKNNAANIDVLIRAYLSGANVKTLCGLVGTLQEQAANLKVKRDTLPMLEAVTKATFYIFYRHLWTSLYDRLKTEIQSLTNHQHLSLWRTTALTMQGLMTVAKAQETKSNLSCFLKKSIGILKIFLSHGIPMMEMMLKSKPDQVVEIFKLIQSNTRFLHHLCCYSKLTKDSGLTAHVPQFRLVLETLVYRVKAALVGNGCSAAFWMGNLKNRDLQGEDILSQSTEVTEMDQEEEEEEALLSDQDQEEEEEDPGQSGSEVFD